MTESHKAPNDAAAKETAAELPMEEIVSIPTAGKKGRTTRSGRQKAKRRGRKTPPPRKRERERSERQVVFAFRLSEAQRARIHQAAGAGQATRFVRGTALAVANGDRKALEELMTQAKGHRTK